MTKGPETQVGAGQLMLSCPIVLPIRGLRRVVNLAEHHHAFCYACNPMDNCMLDILMMVTSSC